MAVRDILDDLRKDNRTLIDDVRTDRKQLQLRESIPDNRPDYIDPEDEVDRLTRLGILSDESARIAMALASNAAREVVAESLGLSVRSVYYRRSKIAAEMIVRGSFAH
jgi:FixJ family two-component response regulator